MSPLVCCRYRPCFISLALLIASLTAVAVFSPRRQARAEAGYKGVEAEHGMVVSVSAAGSDVGLEILKKGGTAVDAAVATAFALAVTYPQAGNIGGGGFMVVYPAPKKGSGVFSRDGPEGASQKRLPTPFSDPVVFEYRETAPAAATKTMFSKDDTWYGHKVAGVPGTVRGLALAHRRFGKLPWKEVVQPAIQLAEEGFILGEALANSLNAVVCSSQEFPELRRVYGKDNGKNDWQDGDLLIQKELAATLRLIAEQGPDVFYKGPIADKIAAEMKAGGGLITKADLAAYQAKERAPIHGRYRGYDVYGPPPPSSGGICLVEMLNILENFELHKAGRFSPETLHLMIEAMRRAYYDRARYLGDADFVKVPAHLTSKEYARTLAQGIDLHKATRSEELARDIPLAREGDSTTHFSVIDKDGMAVANTYTLERSYGSRVVVRGAGFLLNDEMMDFNWRPGFTDRAGTIGTEANQIAPGKRMLSSQTPTIVARDGKVVLVTGSPGSRTIINTVLCILVNVLDYDMDIRAAVDAPRLHHAWFPDAARFEGTREHAPAMERLRKMGHAVHGTRQGDAHSIQVDPKTGHFWGAEDRRISGKVASY
jgi:gamma-glutamyltranspeptidase/glutathione hydrolase